MASIDLDAVVDLDSPLYDCDGHLIAAPVPTPSGGGFVRKRRLVKTVRAKCVFDGGGTFAITQVVPDRLESDDDVLLLLV